jgi:hypothetical protein
MRYLVVVILALTVLAIPMAASSLIGGPAAPTNLEASCSETECDLKWGPAQPGQFVNLGEPKKNSVLVGWGASQDTRSDVTYTLIKDGSTIASGLTQPQYLLGGIPPKSKTMRLCVQAFNAMQQASPQTCGTWSR